MTPRLDNLLPALEGFRAAVARGEHSMRSARNRLAVFRLALLRMRRRDLAIILSEGAWDWKRLDAALAATCAAVEAELEPELATQR